MKIVTTIFLFLLIPVVVYSQTTKDSIISITFIVKCEDIAPSDSIFITGNHESLGNWHPGKIALYLDNNSTWKRHFNFKKGTQLKYKFTRGSWDKEAIYVYGQTPTNSEEQVKNDTCIVVSILTWRDKITPIEDKGQITGNVKYHRGVEGYGLKSRNLIVWLPPGYNQDLLTRYPVLYMHDGQNLFDPSTAAFGKDWQLDETADSLISKNLIEPLIIVGIYNTPDRSLEYMETDTGSMYMKLVVKVIKPLIDKSYRTIVDREHTAVGGSSAGGLISFMLLWEYPDIFSQAACISVPFKYSSENHEINFVENVLEDERAKPDIRIYIDNGDDEVDSMLTPGIQEMIEALKNRGYRQGKDYVWYQHRNSKHNESSWAKISWRFLEFLYGSK
jgi:enterochelin esterase-like enzyme